MPFAAIGYNHRLAVRDEVLRDFSWIFSLLFGLFYRGYIIDVYPKWYSLVLTVAIVLTVILCANIGGTLGFRKGFVYTLVIMFLGFAGGFWGLPFL